MSALRSSASAFVLGLLAAVALLTSAGASARSGVPAGGASDLVEVVVTLPQAPLSRQLGRDRLLASAVRTRAGLDLRAPAAVSYLRTLAAAQDAFQARLAARLPAARVNWHYSVALDGVSVVVPRSQLRALAAIRGATVWPTVTYHDLRDTAAPAGAAGAKLNVTPALIGASDLWGADLATAGQGMKIAILDDGIDQTHPFFSPSGFSYPAGFPKGDTAFTTPKVIVARSFPSPSTTWKYAARPFDPEYSEHATHVAGIAAGDHDTVSTSARGHVLVSGIAPKAYLGNYKVLTVPTQDFGLDGNAPEIAAAIDQAVEDGMNVINLSIGEPAIEPSRDVVVTALDNAAAAGVVSAIAAGNDYSNAGHGSVDSPANAPDAIAVAASSEGSGLPVDDIASFSSSGPTPVSLLLKPDVTAPGENVLSSIPHGGWDVWDGTSMATPHVAGAAALLQERHPTWTPEQVKSALESTGDPVHPANQTTEVPTLREGGGRIDLVRADRPLVFTDPANLSWGLIRRGFVGTKALVVTDAGGGIAPWTVSVATQSAPDGVTLTPGSGTVVPGTTLDLTLNVSQTAPEGDATGFVVLTRGTDVRRVPFWFHVETPQLALDPHTTLMKAGLYHGDTAGKASRVGSYRYPDRGVAPGVATVLSGPEQVFRFTVRKAIANFGVVVLTRATGVRVSPRVVRAGDENRVVGYPGIPATLNPYVGEPLAYPVVGAILPSRGAYDIVFDTPAGATPGKFLFRLWIDDTTPPRVKLLAPSVVEGTPIRLAVDDAGSGVDPASLVARVGGVEVPLKYAHGIVSLATTTLLPGARKISLTVSDYQETKNMEDVGPVRPNTTVFHATVTVKP